MTTTPIHSVSVTDTQPFPYTIRPFRWDDLPAVAALYQRWNDSLGVAETVSEAELSIYYHEPSFNAEAQVRCAVDEIGAIVGVSELEYPKTDHRYWADSIIDPNHRDRGIESAFLRLTEDAVMERTLTAGTPVAVERACVAQDTRTADIFKAHGYRYIRSFYRMGIDLTALGNLQPLQLPDGLELRPFMPEHTRAVYEAQQEAFADHWGWEPTEFEEWQHWTVNRPNADTSLWLIVWDGDEIAAMALNRPYDDEQPDWAWINYVATRRPYRKRGLASALLIDSFRLFKARGYTWAGLGVDASSLTNAVGIYERAGMHVVTQYDEYAKMLRGDWLPIYPSE